jgi:hypothetical protein
MAYALDGTLPQYRTETAVISYAAPVAPAAGRVL